MLVTDAPGQKILRDRRMKVDHDKPGEEEHRERRNHTLHPLRAVVRDEYLQPAPHYEREDPDPGSFSRWKYSGHGPFQVTD